MASFAEMKRELQNAAQTGQVLPPAKKQLIWLQAEKPCQILAVTEHDS